MAIVFVREVAGREGVFDSTPVRDFRRVFLVLVDDLSTHPDQVKDAIGIPTLNEVHPRDSGSKVQRIIPRQMDDHPELWEVSVEYSSRSSQGSQTNPDPLLRPASFDWSTSRRTVPVTKTKKSCGDSNEFTSQAITNSAGEPFDPPPVIPDSSLVLRITRNEPLFDPEVRQFLNCTNMEVFQGFDGCTVLFSDVAATRVFEGDIEFDRVTYTFEINDSDWELELLDQGYYELVSGELKPARDGTEGTLPSKPVLLDGAGRKLASGEDPEFLAFGVFEAKDFGEMSLPDYRSYGDG